MFFKYFLLSLLFLSVFSLKHHKNSQKSFLQASCHQNVYLRNRATGYYLGRGAAYNGNGLQAVLDYAIDHYEIKDGVITNLVNSLVLDVAESDLTKRQVILWPLHEDSTGNQLWVVNNEDTGFASIRSKTYGSLLALASVDAHDFEKGVTLAEFDKTDPRQQWTIGSDV